MNRFRLERFGQSWKGRERIGRKWSGLGRVGMEMWSVTLPTPPPSILSLLSSLSLCPISRLERLFTSYMNSMSHKRNCSLGLNFRNFRVDRACYWKAQYWLLSYTFLNETLVRDCWELMKPGLKCVSLTLLAESHHSLALFKILTSWTVRGGVPYMYWTWKKVANLS